MSKRVWGSVLSLMVLAVTVSPALAQDSGWRNSGLFTRARIGKTSDGLYLIDSREFTPRMINVRLGFEKVVEIPALKVNPVSIPTTARFSPIRLVPTDVQIIWPADGNNVSELKRLFPATMIQPRGSVPDVTHDPIPVWNPKTEKWTPRSPISIDPFGPPPFIPWWLSPFTYAPYHMEYLPAGSAILQKVRGADRYRIVSRPGETAQILPRLLLFTRSSGDTWRLKVPRTVSEMLVSPDKIWLVRMERGGKARYDVTMPTVVPGRKMPRIPTGIAVIKNSGRPGYQFAARGGDMKISNPPLTPVVRRLPGPWSPSLPLPGGGDVRRPPGPWSPSTGANDVARGTVAREVGGLAQFAAAYLVKEGVKAALTGDAEVMKQAVGQMGTGSFWASLGVFTVASGATDFALRALPLNGTAKSIGRAALPLAAGMAAVQVLRGEASAKSVAISTGAYLGAGLAVGAAADAFLYPLLFRATPAGWVTAAWRIGTLAATLYAGEKFEEYLNSLFNGRTQLTGTPSSSARRGIADQVQQLVND